MNKQDDKCTNCFKCEDKYICIHSVFSDDWSCNFDGEGDEPCCSNPELECKDCEYYYPWNFRGTSAEWKEFVKKQSE